MNPSHLNHHIIAYWSDLDYCICKSELGETTSKLRVNRHSSSSFGHLKGNKRINHNSTFTNVAYWSYRASSHQGSLGD